MTRSENFCFRLNDFEGDVKVSWQELQTEKYFCDVTLACEDKQIKTHKVIISSCSPVLRNILELHRNQNPLIYLRRVKYRNLQSLVTYMYQGEVDVAEEDIPGFLEVAEDLNIRGLSEKYMERSQQNGEISIKPTYEAIESSLDSDLSSEVEMKTENEENVPIESFTRDAEDSENFISDNIKSSPFDEIKQKYSENKNQKVVFTFGENRLSCEKCEKQFSTKTGVYYHKRAVHENVRYSCSKCEYKARKKNDLKVHVQSVHENIRYSCSKCEFKATQKHHLKVHVQSVHDGHRYPCDNCDFKATTNRQLHAHQKKYHN